MASAANRAPGNPDGQAPWPAVSLSEAKAILCAPGAQFEMETVPVAGIPTRTWKNAPPSLPALARHAREAFGGSIFVVYEGERVSYEGWFRAVAALAHELAEMGIARGDRVALAMRNLPEWPVAFFAITSLGAIAVPLNGWWTGQELSYGLAHCGAVALIADVERWERIGPHRGALPELRQILVARAAGPLDIPARPLESVIGRPEHYGALPSRDLLAIEIAPDDDATIFYTSGTTGKPKGALGTHRNILNCTLANAFSAQRGMLRRGEEARSLPKTTLVTIPMFHVTACHSMMMATIFFGGRMVFMRKWNADEALSLIERERVNITGGVPTIAWQLLEHPTRGHHDLSSLEMLAYGGAPSAPELVRRIGSDLRIGASNGWGMTETSATVTAHGGEDYLARPDSCGPALPVSDLRIMDLDGLHELPIGAVGELWASGPQIVKGYWDNPEATAATFRDGWVRTGDIARLDEEGFCTIVDRAKDIVIRGGENIPCLEIEDVLSDHPAVVEAAVIGKPHRTLGEEPAAFVVLASGGTASEESLRQYAATRLPLHKVPVRILISPQPLPKNPAGKVIKADLKRLVSTL